MNKLLILKTFSLLFLFLNLSLAKGQSELSADFRDRLNGNSIYNNGYIDQPYVVVLDSREWLCVFTTGAGQEGTGGQHIVSTISTDQGKTWSKPVRIEEPTKESASWAMPYKTTYGRVYVFYDYNGDKIHSLNGKENIREDMLGWYCFKYSDDKGKTWSKRYRLPIRTTSVDLNNDWGGKTQIMWGIGKPINVGKNGMMFGFTKLGKYLLDYGEGWFMRCDNINTERNPEKLKWKNLPEGDRGLMNPAFGPVQEEHNIVELSNGTLYCVYRTVMGHPAESYSYDGGKKWTLPQIPTYYTNREIKHPRACPRIFKTSEGKFLFWQHVNGNVDFNKRNPAWVSGGVEVNGKIVWTQPEILVYTPDDKDRMSYPDLIEQDGKFWITETNKTEGYCHAIDRSFLDKLWNQISVNEKATKGLVVEKTGDNIAKGTLEIPNLGEVKSGNGFTIDLAAEITNMKVGQLLFESKTADGKGMWMEMADNLAVKFTMTDGVKTLSWTSDANLLKMFDTSYISLVVDFRARVISYVINGIFNDGGTERMFGWNRFDRDMGQIASSQLKLADFKSWTGLRTPNKLYAVRVYNRPLMVTECIGNYRNFTAKKS